MQTIFPGDVRKLYEPYYCDVTMVHTTFMTSPGKTACTYDFLFLQGYNHNVINKFNFKTVRVSGDNQGKLILTSPMNCLSTSVVPN